MHGSHAPISLHTHPSSVLPTAAAAGFWVFLLLLCLLLGLLTYCTEIWCASFTLDPFDLTILTLQQPPSRGGCRYLAGFWVVLKATHFFCFDVKTAICGSL
jgi:hypothetical protein